MGEYFRNPTKSLDREFRALGATRSHRTPAGAYYRFPNGAVELIPSGLRPGKALAILASIRARYGTAVPGENGDPLRTAVHRDGAPTITTNNLVMSKHAADRFELMASQAHLDRLEVADALRFPEKVLWSPINESWMWVRGRVVVAAVVTDDHKTLITTLLWATEDLWEQNPRPHAGTP